MIRVWWTTETKTAKVRADGTDECCVCRREQPFTLFVQYHTAKLLGAFGRVSGREYLRLCDVCGHGDVLPVSVATVAEADAVIPYNERHGCLVFAVIVAGCVLFALVAGSIR